MRALALVVVSAVTGCDGLFGLDHVTESPFPDTSLIDVVPTNCPGSYDKTVLGSVSKYRIESELQTWIAAADACAADSDGQTHLIVVSNLDELNGLRGFASIFLPDDTWAGATAIKLKNNQMQWITDEDTHGFIIPSVPIGTAPWESDQPDEGAGVAEMRGVNDPAPGNLHDEKPDSTSLAICECDGRRNIEATYR